MSPQLAVLEKNKGLDFSYEIPGLARFRANVIRQRKGHDAVFRIINTSVRTMDELGLPEQLKVLTQYHNGLVLLTGAVGCGKSTTLAAMVQEINTHRQRSHHHAGRPDRVRLRARGLPDHPARSARPYRVVRRGVAGEPARGSGCHHRR